MKKVFICLSLLVVSSFLFAQNLIFDSGIDNNSNCPIECGTLSMNFTLAHNTYYWKSGFDFSGYNHYCGDTTICPPRLWHGIPYNFVGYQYPQSDSGYASVYAGWGFVSNRRGFVYQKMKENLIPNKKYWVEYYTSLCDSSSYAVRSMGATFTMDTLILYEPLEPYFNRTFKLENQEDYLTDKVRWTQLHWIFEADSAYQTFLMGYARNVQNLDTIFVGSSCSWCTDFGNKFSFYYLEDAGVFPIISNNQNVQVCNFPYTLQGAVGNDIWFREWSDTSHTTNLQIYSPGMYTQTWRTDTTVHIDTFWVEANLSLGNYLGVADTVYISQTGSIQLNGPNGYLYLWNNNQTSQSITVNNIGTYWLRITDQNGCNRYDTVVVRYDTTVQVWDEWGEKELVVFPNPAGEVLTIKINSVVGGITPTTGANSTDKINAQLYSSEGKMLQETEFNGSHTLDVSEYSNGIYFIKLVALGKNRLPVFKRLVIAR